jgi:hypothetical protein
LIMSPWIPIDSAAFNVPHEEEVRGVRITVLCSPHDIPSDIRGFYEESIERFVIEFKYIADEPLQSITDKPLVKVIVGKNSGRLFRIEVDVKSLDVREVQLQVRVPQIVQEAIGKLRSKYLKRKANYDVAERILRDKKEQITDELQKSAM